VTVFAAGPRSSGASGVRVSRACRPCLAATVGGRSRWGTLVIWPASQRPWPPGSGRETLAHNQGLVRSMADKIPPQQAAVPVLADQAGYLIATAARAPSVHNTQPWRFKGGPDAIELFTDQRRKLRVDPAGREMLISCGAALFGLRLAVRSLGYLPVVGLLPDPAKLRLLARVQFGAALPMTGTERAMLAALPHRHTHRGPFADGPLPAGLLVGLQHDALAGVADSPP
jgi:hypothetical protein